MNDRNYYRMTVWRARAASLLAPFLAAIALGLCGCKKAAPAALPPPVVQVLEVAATGAPMHSEIIGQLDSPQNVQIRARVEAFVEQMLFTEGTEVKMGDPHCLQK